MTWPSARTGWALNNYDNSVNYNTANDSYSTMQTIFTSVLAQWRTAGADEQFVGLPGLHRRDYQNRVVTLICLSKGELITHSTGPFSRSNVREIKQLGTPAWMTDAILRHGTFANDGRVAFRNIPYLAAEGFAARAHVNRSPLKLGVNLLDAMRVSATTGKPAVVRSLRALS